MAKKQSYITQLNKKQEKSFRSWYDKTSKKLGLDPDPDNYKHYYDYRGYYKEFGFVPMEEGRHFTDTYKLPGHPTFSNESKYSNFYNQDITGRWGNNLFEIGEGEDNYIKPGTSKLPIKELGGNIMIYNTNKLKKKKLLVTGGPTDVPARTTVNNNVMIPLTETNLKDDILKSGFVQTNIPITEDIMRSYMDSNPDTYRYLPRQFDKKGRPIKMGTENPSGRIWRIESMPHSNPRTPFNSNKEYYKLTRRNTSPNILEKQNDLLSSYESGGWLTEGISGGIEGASLGSSISPGWGTAIGAVLGFGLGALGGYNEDQAEADQERRQKIAETYHPAVSKSKQIYDTVAVANGGNLNRLSKRTDYKGESHAMGGINLPIDVQVEDGESRTGDIVHSKKIKITPAIMKEFGGRVPLRKGDVGRSVSDVVKSRDKRFEKRSGDEWNDTARKVSQLPFETMSEELSVQFAPDQVMSKGGKLTKSKAREILRDGSVRGHKLTDKQKRFFGAKGYAEGGMDLSSLLSSENLSSISSALGMFESILTPAEEVNYKPAKYTPTTFTPISTEGGVNRIRRSFGDTRERLRRLNPRMFMNQLANIGSAEAETIGGYTADIQAKNAQNLNQKNMMDSQNANRANMANAQINMQSAQDSAANEAARSNMIASYAANTATIEGQKASDQKRISSQDSARKDYMDILRGYQEMWGEPTGRTSSSKSIEQPETVINQPNLINPEQFFGTDQKVIIGYDSKDEPIYSKENGGDIAVRATKILSRRHKSF